MTNDRMDRAIYVTLLEVPRGATSGARELPGWSDPCVNALIDRVRRTGRLLDGGFSSPNCELAPPLDTEMTWPSRGSEDCTWRPERGDLK